MRVLSIVMTGLLPLAMAACELNLKPGAQSILDAIDTEIAPGDLAAMSLDEYDANNRYLGTLGLANQTFANEPIYIRLFETNAADPEPSVRIAATRGLARHGDPSHVPLLVAALGDKNTLVRLEAARGLQRLHHPMAIDALVVAMREPDPRNPRLAAERSAEVRAQAALALGQYPEYRVVQSLIAGLDDADLAVNRASQHSLRVLTGQDLGLESANWLDWLERTSDPFAARGVYYYPVFNRPMRLYEYLPFIPPPPNETSGPPAGMPLQ